MKGLPWFRCYVDFLKDPKMVGLAFEDQRHFFGICALKCSGLLDQNCTPEMMNRIVAQELWVDFGIISDVKKRLIEAHLIDDMWHPIAWEKRQYPSDSSAARTRKYRENKKKEGCDGDVTSQTPSQERHSDAIDKSRRDKSRVDIAQRFNAFWSLYPKKKGKGAAERSWAKLDDQSHELAISDLTKRVGHDPEWLKDDGKFIPYPATYLNQERWSDDWAPVEKGSRRGRATL